MIDTHCHLLWRLDDGPRSQIASIDLARSLVDQGVEAVLCTPHYSTQFPTQPASTRARFDELGRSLAVLSVGLRLELAAEIASSLTLSVPLEELKARSIGGFVLVELEPRAAAATPLLVLDRLRGTGLTPIFAHPERNRSIRADPAALDEARREGALAQVVASSLVGRWGPGISGAGWALLDSGRVDLLASDAHGPAGSVQRLREVVERVGLRYGSGVVESLTRRTPAKVLSFERAGSRS
jgi:protein-tyrosine phosphatase